MIINFFQNEIEKKNSSQKMKFLYTLVLVSISLALTNAACTDLVSFSHPNIIGYSGTIRVHTNFRSYMNSLATLAVNCGAKVYVTSSFRAAGTSVTNTVVPPASYSNHNAGYAIDFNLGPASGTSITCNSSCLGGATSAMPTYAQCFTGGITGLGLRWGQNFSVKDPVHIDFPVNNNLTIFNNIVQGLFGC